MTFSKIFFINNRKPNMFRYHSLPGIGSTLDPGRGGPFSTMDAAEVK